MQTYILSMSEPINQTVMDFPFKSFGRAKEQFTQHEYHIVDYSIQITPGNNNTFVNIGATGRLPKCTLLFYNSLLQLRKQIAYLAAL